MFEEMMSKKSQQKKQEPTEENFKNIAKKLKSLEVDGVSKTLQALDDMLKKGHPSSGSTILALYEEVLKINVRSRGLVSTNLAANILYILEPLAKQERKKK
jgi:hypothetical protein